MMRVGAPVPTEAARIFPAGGVAGEALRATDWSSNPLGPLGGWPPALRTIVRIMLSTRQATCLFWGPHLVNLYNDGFVPILGEKHPKAMGQRAEECWSEAWPVVGGLLADVIARGQAVLFEEMLVPIVRKGRLEDAWWNYSYSPAFDDEGAIAGVLVIATETTGEVAARKQLEAAKSEAELARTKEAKLRETAELASRAKDEFLATVSHELRNPLNAILGWARILGDGHESPRIQKGIGVILHNALAQAKLIDDILDVSRIIAGKVIISPRPVQLANVIQNAVESALPAARAKQIRLEVSIQDADVDFVADEDRLQQVVWNLLSNAVKFTPPGGEVRVTATKESSRVTLRVEDNGKGIAPALLPFVFDRFRQGDATTTKQYAGLGLGLAIVRYLVELHGGTVSARSEGEGRGACFETVLPIRAAPPRQPLSPPPPPSGSAERREPLAPRSLEGIDVLVVDDEAHARDLLDTVLGDAGAHVTVASSVSEAMKVLATAPFGVIVSDIGMPVEDGYTLVARVRAEGSQTIQEVPMLALTAFARAEDRSRARDAGFQEHVAKPIDPDALVRAVAALARRSSTPRE